MSILDYSVVVLMVGGGIVWLIANWLSDAKKWKSVVAVIVIMFGLLKWYFRW